MKSDSIIVKKRVAIVTNNVNCERHIQYYSNIEKYFKANGWEIAEDFDVDKVIICCCGFHDLMYEKVIRTVGHLKNRNYLENNIIIMGCQSRTHKPELSKNTAAKLIGFGREKRLDEIIHARIPFSEISPNNIFRPYKGCKIDEKNEFFHIKIAQGCLRQCTFCVINKAKGYIKSEPVETIIEQYKKAVQRGNRKIYLMGEDTLAYGIDCGSDIIRLVDQLLEIEPDVEINFGSLHIRWLQKYADGVMALCRRGIVKELHIGLQHIDDVVLKRMGRPIVFAEVYEILKSLKRECPELLVEADILVGFPGETEEQFNRLIEFWRRDEVFGNVRHFGFSDVKGAPSYRYTDKIPQNEVVSRWERLDRVLRDRSSNYKSEEASTTDVAFQLTHERDYNFCKDTFKDDVEHQMEDIVLHQATSKLNIKELESFEF
jgi:MiaB/RimO family radical SAM methylthiotransferase